MARLPAIIRNAIDRVRKSLASVVDNRGWYRISESFAGAWQQNVTVDRDAAISFHAVFSCITLIAADIAKLRIKLVEQDDDGIWSETSAPAFSPVLRKPNHFQNRIQFLEQWFISKLTRGNAYILKERDGRGIVIRLYVLDPNRVTPMVADDGAVFYQLTRDALTGQEENTILVPAREIIHDRMNCLFHPLIGISPLWANGLAATQGLNIQKQSSWFFANRGVPGGILTAPGAIADETAARLKATWDTNFGGENAGKIAVVGDGLTFSKVPFSAEEAQLIEQLKWTAEVICSTFHVPPYKIGVGPMPAYNNIQALNVEYYSQCLQKLIEDAELCLDEGLGLVDTPDRILGTEFDIDNLLRMDSVTQMAVLKEGVGAAILAPDEARRKLDLPKVKGGASPLAQQQNFSLEALAKRDAKDDPFASSTPAKVPPPAEVIPPDPGNKEMLAWGGKVETVLEAMSRRLLEPPVIAPSDDDLNEADVAQVCAALERELAA